ncbi:RNA polymerase sigma factor [Actinomadura rubteroloni]|uniref:RNA polymerase sigma factor n=1 Tax=Actinomadura rubteroloni TaxID=1926885 RepID=A0A2P4UNF3_9ACTN|nr:sigma-70 family RNA polymerase sigma factor [Actinomadura rubteroloni]POM26566.1 RNA polymerase sigma factor [Actinomadura rubteroloni]
MAENAPSPAPAEPSDAALIARVRTGDLAAYGPLYERHLAAARGLARHLIDGDAAEDAVQDAFARILDAIGRGGGPASDFRPYLLTSVRRAVYDRYRDERRVEATDELERLDAGLPFEDPALHGLERSMIVRAYRSLPERWRAVLWHTEIEGAKPAEVAPLLGLTANGVAALAYRAREGLRQAYLQMHLADPAAPVAGNPPPADEACRPVLEKLGAYVRDGLAKRDTRTVKAHLRGCARCSAIYAELVQVNTALRDGLGPIILGAAGLAYLAKGGWGGTWVVTRFRRLPKRQQQAVGGGVAAAVAAAAAALALMLASGATPLSPSGRPQTDQPHQVAAPPAAPPAAPKPAKPAKPPAPAPKPVKPAPAEPVANTSPAASPSRPPAHVTARIGTVGALVRDRPGIVAMTVGNDGRGATDDLAAAVDLPPGVAYDGARSGRLGLAFTPVRAPGGGWACRPQGTARVVCTHAPVPAGATTSAYLRVRVARDAPLGPPARLTLSGGGTAVSARADQGVSADGMPARFATEGRVRTVETGNALLGCDATRSDCRQAMDRRGPSRDDDLYSMRPIDRDDDPTTRTSSAARLDAPSDVLWAGLYWSGSTSPGSATMRLRAPGTSAYTTVRAAETGTAELPNGPAYQAFADVTALVRAHGGGVWWGADAPAESGFGRYAGWALVVVVRDAQAPFQQAMVLDRTTALGPQSAAKLDVRPNGLLAAARPATIGLVAWEGDADLPGDALSLAGRPLTPLTGDRSPNNVLDGSTPGALGTKLTFGLDVDRFSASLNDRPVLTLSTGRDAVLVGVVTVTAPTRT